MRTLTTFAAGLALLVGAPAAWELSRPAQSVGSLASVESMGQPGPAAGAPAKAAVAAPAPTTEARRTGDPLAAVRPDARAPAPAVVRIPAIGVEAEVVAVATEVTDGQVGMEVPADVATVGWYRHGPRPGEAGSTVIAGHVDSRRQGQGAFFGLRELQVGDEVEVEDVDGGTTTWIVQGRQVIEKAVIPVEDVFARDGIPRLTLITCGGPFDYGTGHYLSNVVVVAVPAPT